MILRTYFINPIQLSMKIEEINNHALNGVHQGIVTKAVLHLLEPEFHVVEVHSANLLLLGSETHDGVFKER